MKITLHKFGDSAVSGILICLVNGHLMVCVSVKKVPYVAYKPAREVKNLRAFAFFRFYILNAVMRKRVNKHNTLSKRESTVLIS